MLNMVLAIIMDVYAEAARCLFQKVLQCISHYSCATAFSRRGALSAELSLLIHIRFEIQSTASLSARCAVNKVKPCLSSSIASASVFR